MIVILLLTVIALYIAHYVWRRSKLPPGPWGLPIIGYLPWLDPSAPYLTLTKLSKQYGEVYGLQLGGVYTVVLTNPKEIKDLFSKESTTGRAPLYLTHGIMKGYGLICAEGNLWKDQRKFVHTCLKRFGASKSSTQRDKMNFLIKEHIHNFFKDIESLGSGIPIDPFEYLHHSIGSIVNVLVFGKTWSRDNETWKWLLKLQEEGTKQIGVAGPLNFLPFLRFIPKYKRTMNFLIDGKHETHLVYKQIIEDQISKSKKDGENDTANDNIIKAFLMERGKVEGTRKEFYTDQQFYHLLADIFGASLDTTFATLRWFLLFLAKNQMVQQSVHNEIKIVLEGREPYIDDMSFLPLLEACICETQRIRTVVPVGIPHGTTSALTIKGFNIPKGTMLVPLQWAIHMNEIVWREAENFNPGRFLDSQGKLNKSEHFIPFQVGKRMCIGEELARIILFLYGTSILQQFSLHLENEDIDLIGECGITLTPKPYKLLFNKR